MIPVLDKYDFTCTQEECDLFDRSCSDLVKHYLERKVQQFMILDVPYKYKKEEGVDERIVAEVKTYFTCPTETNLYCIYNFCFENSYKKAFDEMPSCVHIPFWRKAKIFLCSSKDPASLCHNVPSELVRGILMLNMALYDFPDYKSFQVKIWKQQFQAQEKAFLKDILQEFDLKPGKAMPEPAKPRFEKCVIQ